MYKSVLINTKDSKYRKLTNKIIEINRDANNLNNNNNNNNKINVKNFHVVKNLIAMHWCH